jgi:hypothetical protein
MPTCSFCEEDYSKKVHIVLHGINYDCDLKPHSAHELYDAATAAYNLRIHNHVKDFYTKILERVAEGRFSISFDFTCYPEEDRMKLLTTIIDRLKAKLKDILITTDSTGHEFDVCWSQPAKSFGKFYTPECVETEIKCETGDTGKKQIPKEIKTLVWNKYIGNSESS